MKNKLFSLLSLSLILTLPGCGLLPSHSSSNLPEEKEPVQEEAPVTTPSSAQNNMEECIKMYADVLKEKMNGTDSLKFCFTYVDNDEYPELIFSEQPNHGTCPSIYTYHNHLAYELQYSFDSETEFSNITSHYGEFTYGEDGLIFQFLFSNGGFITNRFFRLKSGDVALEEELYYTNGAQGQDIVYEINKKSVSEEDAKQFIDKCNKKHNLKCIQHSECFPVSNVDLETLPENYEYYVLNGYDYTLGWEGN